MQKAFISMLTMTLLLGSLSMPVLATYDDSTSDTSSSVNSITLSGTGSSIEWSVNGYSSKGFKVVWSKNENPTYPLRDGDKYNYYTDPEKSSDILTAFSGEGTYYVRVCEYLGGSCGVYSNQITLSLGSGSQVACTMEYNPVCGANGNTYSNKCMAEAAGTSKAYYGECTNEESGNVNSITLQVEGDYAIWEIDGTSPKGFKVVWSKNENPTYPNREGDKYYYFSDPSKRKAELKAFSGDGIYYVRVCEYLGGACGVYSNQMEIELNEGGSVTACTKEYDPVCGADGKTYSNKCMAEASGTYKEYYGMCTDKELEQIEENAEKLSQNDLDSILTELEELRNTVKEQENQIKYLQKLLSNVQAISDEMQTSINNFITYGVDKNTKELGEGERAAVIYSFKAAYGKLPEDELELSDAVKIANGRFPSMKSKDAESEAQEKFQEIYKRIADMRDSRDEAAITVMAYGLRQKAENRNLKSEENGIKIFRSVFGKNPETTEEWNAMQAITYSGATRGVDSDGDLLVDEREGELGTDPENPDTDSDGYLDGIEVANGHDPLNG